MQKAVEGPFKLRDISLASAFFFFFGHLQFVILLARFGNAPPSNVIDCVVLKTDAMADYTVQTADNGTRGYAVTQALRMHVWMATVHGVDDGVIPAVGRMEMRIPTTNCNWTEVVPQFAVGSIHKCARRGALRSLAHITDSGVRVGNNEAPGFNGMLADVTSVLWVLVALYSMLLYLYASIAAILNRKVSAREWLDEYESICAHATAAAIIYFVGMVAFMIVSGEMDKTCTVIGTQPLGDAGVRIWAVTDSGGAEFDYMSVDPVDRRAVLGMVTDQPSVACTATGYGSHPSRLFFRRYTHTVTSVTASDIHNLEDEVRIPFIVMIVMLAAHLAFRALMDAVIKKKTGMSMVDLPRYKDPTFQQE